jgi:HemY protein
MAGNRRRRAAGSTARDPGAGGVRVSRRGLRTGIGVVILAAGLAGATWFFTDRAARAGLAARVPEPPPIAEMSDALRQVVTRADAALRNAIDARASDETIGRAAGSLGELYQANARAERAAAAYAMAMDLDPQNPRWPYLMATLRQERGETESVTDLLERTVQLDPEYSPAWLKLADSQFKQGDAEAARASYERRLALTPGDPWAHLGLARIAQAGEEWELAESHLHSAIETDPDYGPALRLLATVHGRFGRDAERAEAQARADEAGRFAPAPDPWVDGLLEHSYDVESLLMNVTRYAYVGDGTIAQRLFNRAKQLDPENPDVYLLFGQHAQNPDEAAMAYRMAISLDPDNVEAHALLGELLLLANRPAEAEPLLRRAIELGSMAASTYKNLGLSLAATGQVDEAIAAIEQALVLSPQAISSHYSLAYVLGAAGRRSEAIRQYRRLLELQPTHVGAREELAALTGSGGP